MLGVLLGKQFQPLPTISFNQRCPKCFQDCHSCTSPIAISVMASPVDWKNPVIGHVLIFSSGISRSAAVFPRFQGLMLLSFSFRTYGCKAALQCHLLNWGIQAQQREGEWSCTAVKDVAQVLVLCLLL